MGTFKMPTKIFFGKNALQNIQQLSMKRVLIVCDPFMEKSGKVETITQLLEKSDVQHVIYSKIVPDPTLEVVTGGAAAAISLQPDTIIALGGGSALDSAKAIRQIYQTFAKDHIDLVCVPTTSGTGSEVTSFAVISDPEVQAKYALVDDSMLPEFAILDPEFTVTVPASITADTGMDVLTHTLEAYVSTEASDFTDACAEKAMRMVWATLGSTVRNGADLANREKMHNASCLAGIAFSEASLGICHSLAHALGGKFHIPHGRVNAMLLPHIIAYNAGLDLNEDTVTLKKYAEAAQLLGIQTGTTRGTVHGLISGIKRQMKQMGLPKTIEEFGLDPEEFKQAIPEMAEKAMADRCTLTNPRQPKLTDLEALYGELCRGGF